MAKKCQCRGRIRTNTDGTCVSSGDICKSCIAIEQARIDAKVIGPTNSTIDVIFKEKQPTASFHEVGPKVVDQKVESGLSVDSKVEIKPKSPPAEVVPIWNYEATKTHRTTSNEKGPKKA